MRHFISVKQLSNKNIYSLLERAEMFRREQLTLGRQLFVGNLFFEPSTRTKMSFIVGERKLGMEALDFHCDKSSVQKGESLYDTARTFESIGAKLLVVRHPADTWIDEINANINIPIINAGAGKEEHPTQCMLDLLTIYQEFGYLKGLNIVIAGDIKHSRVARSNAQAFKRLGANVYFSAAPGFEDDTMEIPYLTMDEAVEKCDVLMLLRIQHERHDRLNNMMSNYLQRFGLTFEREQKMKERSIIMHPAPINRGVEMDTGLVECERSRIFKQMENGVYMRMAIMTTILQEWGIIHENTLQKCENIASGQHKKAI
ncbi:MAG TPA: aspartate carbamoyltransferase catalytic subunit [Virgibacillus sp.]|nr:aspartate carbamoyltransferase catalytic subunit [Virgibacillus sp.]